MELLHVVPVLAPPVLSALPLPRKPVLLVAASATLPLLPLPLALSFGDALHPAALPHLVFV
jgi:hypothetical protein